MRILYFAKVAEKVGETQETVTLPPEVRDVRGLLAWLRGRGADWDKALADDRVQVLVDRQQTTPDTAVSDRNEVAIV
jgi:molybdopterin synthase sulfur carrier subunit